MSSEEVKKNIHSEEAEANISINLLESKIRSINEYVEFKRTLS